MKKKLIALFIVVAMFACLIPCGAFADNMKNEKSETFSAPRIYPWTISFTGNSGTYYSVDISDDYVGFGHITTGNVVKVCQAYTKLTGANPGSIDGIWGQNSETALRIAQQTMQNNGYPNVTSDGVCGPNTWKGFYGFNGGITNALKSLL